MANTWIFDVLDPAVDRDTFLEYMLVLAQKRVTIKDPVGVLTRLQNERPDLWPIYSEILPAVIARTPESFAFSFGLVNPMIDTDLLSELYKNVLREARDFAERFREDPRSVIVLQFNPAATIWDLEKTMRWASSEAVFGPMVEQWPLEAYLSHQVEFRMATLAFWKDSGVPRWQKLASALGKHAAPGNEEALCRSINYWLSHGYEWLPFLTNLSCRMDRPFDEQAWSTVRIKLFHEHVMDRLRDNEASVSETKAKLYQFARKLEAAMGVHSTGSPAERFFEDGAQ